jgi:hypothetical protein
MIEIPSTRPNSSKFVVYKYKDIIEKIIPFFEKSPLQTVKLFNFEDFRKIANLMKEKAHLTEEGIEEIRRTKKNMNVGRV